MYIVQSGEQRRRDQPSGALPQDGQQLELLQRINDGNELSRAPVCYSTISLIFIFPAVFDSGFRIDELEGLLHPHGEVQ